MSTLLAFWFLAAFAAVASLVPLMGRVAMRLGLTSLPDPAVGHTRVIPLLGGGAILAGIAPALVTCAVHDAHWLAVGIAVAIMASLGAYKDWVRRDVSPFGQLAVQIASVILLVSAIGPMQLTGNTTADAALSLICCVWIINGWNFLDVMDGLAGGVAVIVALFFAAGHWHIGNIEGAMLSAVLAGCMAGFLVYNYPPASIFMGDLGSFPLGLLFCSLLLSGASTAHLNSTAAFGIMVFVPLCDVAAATLTRLLAGRSPLKGHGPDHLSLRLSQLGWSNQAVLLAVYLLAVLTGLLGLGLLKMSPYLL
jgi:UDP-GlcNAc:undecaprenyl-phosphate GlcNAc-1-phosphate transferase